MNLVVVGLQWGDEGKGKLVDVLSQYFDIVVRFQGGSNAGHTVKTGDETFKLRILPTGAVRGKTVVIGNGVVIDPKVLAEETHILRQRGKDFELRISDRAHIITPYQIALDRLREKQKGNQKVGTTKRGIGPTYSDKHARLGVRVCDFYQNTRNRQWELMESKSIDRLKYLHNEEPTPEMMSAFSDYKVLMEGMSEYVCSCSEYLLDAIEDGKRILFEGAQGALLDIDHGTYPFVTSSNCISSAAATGSGVPPSKIRDVLGVTKTYTTRVGTGPFPTELQDDIGRKLQKRGNEYGTVTGRPRRCGWLDLVALRYTVRLNGAQYIAVTKADVLSGIEELDVCVAYEIDGSETYTLPSCNDSYDRLSPVYKTLRGWPEPKGGDWSEMIDDGYENLPGELRQYLEQAASYCGTEVGIVSLGPDRDDTIMTTAFEKAVKHV
ncbi:adenylosuccinate synthase [Candidatus Thorarchaeota archaeon]|nr:MAG: adenylosuccinate synthase [Candidatus Thorarchaeota archaeon]